MSNSPASSTTKVTYCEQAMDKSWNYLVNYQMSIPRTPPNKHNNLFQCLHKNCNKRSKSIICHFIMKDPVNWGSLGTTAVVTFIQYRWYNLLDMAVVVFS